MDPVVIFGTRSEGVTVIDVKRAGGAPPDQVLFEITGDGLSASTWVYEHPDFAGLLRFLVAMQRDWRGWNGRRDWASLEGQISITAEHTGRHILLDVAMQRHPDWNVRITLTVGPGEDVTNAARTAKSVLT